MSKSLFGVFTVLLIAGVASGTYALIGRAVRLTDFAGWIMGGLIGWFGTDLVRWAWRNLR